ncbi:DegT/DnrJ/EryC1/StrS family aminotransferase [Patescibacteria group bacterium]|nr:DegT/DnrJ/EryC1/StrS family aminotransferase [Patescibacteria group bacterium]MCL5409274.1 DegT/DnrJ/EryC1/StrS family aminotransferase [Patescibacteria group bacterium]
MNLKKFIPVSEPDLSGNERKYLAECVKSGWVSSQGPFVSKLEKMFSAYLGAKYTAAVSSGTAGLHLSMLTLGIGPGDEVIVPTLTFIATVNAVRYVGASPVFIDSDTETWNMDVSKLEQLINRKTKAIMPVHLYGHPVDMDPVLSIAKKHKLYVIEDAAEAHGAEYKKKKVGVLGDIGVFSLFGNKVITSGEGGLVVTNSRKLDHKIRLYRDQGLTKNDRRKYHYWHNVVGYNYDMSNLQAAVALAQLERIETLIAKKRLIKKIYESYLVDAIDITINPSMEWANSIYWMFSVLLSKKSKISRNSLIRKLHEKGIDSRPFFYPIHTLPPYATGQSFPIAEDLAKRGLNLPSSVLLTKNQIKYICQTLKELLSGNK